MDFVVGGGSAIATEEYLNKFSKAQRPDIKVKMLIFSPVPEPEKIAEAKKDYEVISVRDYAVLSQRWLFSWFDERAEFNNFSFPFEGSELIKPNLGNVRTKFLEYYRSQMQTDPKLNFLLHSCSSRMTQLNSSREMCTDPPSKASYKR